MYLTLTNNSGAPVPIMSTDEGGWAETLPPGQSQALSHTDSDVVIIGNKPSVTEAIKQGVSTAIHIIEAWQAHNNAQPKADDASVRVAIQNAGEKDVRVILGDGTSDYTVAPNETYQATAFGYLELRELGNVQEDPNQPEAV